MCPPTSGPDDHHMPSTNHLTAAAPHELATLDSVRRSRRAAARSALGLGRPLPPARSTLGRFLDLFDRSRSDAGSATSTEQRVVLGDGRRSLSAAEHDPRSSARRLAPTAFIDVADADVAGASEASEDALVA